MTRNFRNVVWFFFGVLLAGVGEFSYAQAIPVTPGGSYPATPSYYSGVRYLIDKGWTACKHDGNAACASIAPETPYINATYQYCVNTPTNATVFYQIYQTHNGCQGTDYTCPNGGTLSGSNCITQPTCPSGYTMSADKTTCFPNCPAAGSSVGSASSWYAGGGSGTSVCISGCWVNGSTCVSGFGGGGLTGRACQGPFVATGESCSSSAAGTNGTPNTSADPATEQNNEAARNCLESGQGYGTVNGVVVCSGTAPNTDSTATKTTNTNGETTTTKKTTSCTGGQCTTTTVESGPGGTSTTTTTEPRDDFCAERPQDIACRGDTEQDDYCKTHPDSFQCMKAGTPSDGSDSLSSKALGVSSVTAVGVAMNMGCPAPLSLPRNWGVIDFAPICNLADLIRPLVIAFAWLAAGFIVIGA